MKKKIRFVFIAVIFITAPMLLFAQQPPHPNGGNAPNATNGPVGGGAAIGSSISIMIAMGAAYGMRRLYQTRITTTE
jgi:hypothetical protein